MTPYKLQIVREPHTNYTQIRLVTSSNGTVMMESRVYVNRRSALKTARSLARSLDVQKEILD